MSATGKTLLGALALVVCVLVGLTLHGLREDPARGSAARDGAAPGVASYGRTGGAIVAASGSDIPPWQAHVTADDEDAAALPGTVPAWRIDPPRPDPSTPMPAAAVPPPNPALHRPPMDNPGGVDGDRPARAVPGLD